jgi:Flp pilus assembly protein TadD
VWQERSRSALDGRNQPVIAEDYTLAAAVIDRSLELNPNSAHAWNARGYVAYFQNQLDTASEAFQRAVRLSPLDPLGLYFRNGLALVALAAGKYGEALEWADLALREMPDNPLALRCKAIAYVQLGRIEQARNSVKRLLELRPSSTIAQSRMAVMRRLPSEVVAVQVDSLRKAGMPEG